MGPPKFKRSSPNEHKNFVDEIHITLKVMHAFEIEVIELDSY